MHPVIRSFRFTTLALALVLIAVPALAATPVANVDLGFNQVTWNPQNEFAGLTLTVSAPDGAVYMNDFGPNEAPQLDLSALGASIDGLYTWELRAAPVVDQVKMTAESRTATAGTRPRPADLPSRDSLVQSGSFRVLNGTIVQPAAETDGPSLAVDTAGAGVGAATAPLERITAADNVVNDDMIVDGSLCVGMDCVNGENFGFDTMRLKENNLRIHFNDTSNSGSFPTRDWRLVANGSNNGDPEYFSVQDAGTSRDVFYIEADAPSHALHVDSAGGGRIGIKTSAPAVDIHVVEGNTPTLRLHQDGSDGFAQQIWDVAGNETNFFLRDVTNGSDLPLRVYPGTGDDNLVLRNGRVGVGTNNPDSGLHLKSTSAAMHVESNTASFVQGLTLENTGGGNVGFRLANSTDTIDFNIVANSTGFGDTEMRINVGGSPQELTLYANGNLQITGSLLANNGANTFPDYVFEDDYDLMSLGDLQSYIDEHKHLPGLMSADEVQGNGNTVNVNLLQTQMLEKLEEVVLYTLAQEREIQSLKQELSELRGATETVER